MRMVCETPRSGVSCFIQMPGGQQHYRDSPHYDDMLDYWLNNVSVPLLFNVDQAGNNAEETFIIVPQ